MNDYEKEKHVLIVNNWIVRYSPGGGGAEMDGWGGGGGGGRTFSVAAEGAALAAGAAKKWYASFMNFCFCIWIQMQPSSPTYGMIKDVKMTTKKKVNLHLFYRNLGTRDFK